MKFMSRNIAAAAAGLVLGSVVNLGLIAIGLSLVPIPEGADVSTMAAVRESMKLLPPQNFVFPFLGHAIGTLAGAFLVAKLAASHHKNLALGIGAIFLAGGIAMVLNCGGPVWFIAADLVLAYLPMALLGSSLAGRRAIERTSAPN
jgi:hypothetical protein